MADISYHEVLDMVHRTLYPRTYVEIGIRHGDGVALALSGTSAVGIDPDPKILRALPAALTIQRCTSDDYFDSGRIASDLGGLPIDLAFIDGMHLCEFTLRDFLNIEQQSHGGSVVLIHDCLPRTASEASRTQSSCMWTGDVWKLLLYFRDHRPDLDVCVLDASPTGLAVVQGLDPEHAPVDVDSVARKYEGATFDDFLTDLRPSMRIVGGTWADMRGVFPRDPWQSLESMQGLLAERASRRPTLATRAERIKFGLLSTSVARDPLGHRSRGSVTAER